MSDIQKLKEGFISVLHKDTAYYPDYARSKGFKSIPESVSYILNNPSELINMFLWDNYDRMCSNLFGHSTEKAASYRVQMRHVRLRQVGYKQTEFYKMLESFQIIEKPDLRKFL
jgi:hypothetical protein